jgi:hypothetical protein
MKKCKLTKPTNLNLLTEQLFDAFPEWRRPDPLGMVDFITDVVIMAEEIAFPEDTDPAAVQAVIDSHDPAEGSANEKRRDAQREKKDDLKERVKKAKGVDELRDILLEVLE